MVSKHTADDLDSLDSERIRVDLPDAVFCMIWSVKALEPKYGIYEASAVYYLSMNLPENHGARGTACVVELSKALVLPRS